MTEKERDVLRAVRQGLERLERNRGEWFFPALLVLVRDGLESLRGYLEDGTDPEISWAHPVVELQWPIPWDWDKWEAGAGWAGPDDVEAELGDAIRNRGDAQRNVAMTDALVDHFVRNVLLSVASWWPGEEGPEADGALYGLVRRGDGYDTNLPTEMADWLQAMTEEERAEALADLYEPFEFNRDGLERVGGPELAARMMQNLGLAIADEHCGPEKPPEERPPAEDKPGQAEPIDEKWLRSIGQMLADFTEDPIRLNVHPEGRRERKVSVRLQVRAFVVDPQARNAYIPTVVAVVDTVTGEPADLSDLDNEERAFFWEMAFKALAYYQDRDLDLMGVLRRLLEVEAPATAQAQTAKVTAGPPQRYLLDGPTRMARPAVELLNQVDRVTLPRKWATVRRWEDLVAEERDRLEADLGELAFRPTDERGPLLRRTSRFEGSKAEKVRVESVELTKEAEEALLENLNGKTFRRVHKDEDGASREYLIKRVKVTGGGTLEVRLSWYNHAWPLVDSERDERYRQVLEQQKRVDSLQLFEDLQEEERERADRMLQNITAIRDGRKVMECILAAFGRDGRNPVEIPAWELRTLLGCEMDPNGLYRVRGCLKALQEIRFSLSAAKYRAFGPFLATVEYVRGGAGGHGDGTFLLSVGEPFLGALKVFEAGNRIRNASKVYNWSKDLAPDEVKALGHEDGYVRGFSALGAFYDAARGFTDSQGRLRRWLEHELTLNSDRARKGREDLRVKKRTNQTASRPRAYDFSFCPLLEPGRRYFGALGHFKPNPESGRTLYGTGSAPTATGGGRTEGLMAVLGYEVPSGPPGPKRTKAVAKALEDLRAVVEEALGGRVAVFYRSRWLSLEQAVAELPEKELGQTARWFLFVADDWEDRLRRDIEAYQEARHQRGETPYRVKVTQDREVHRRSREALRGVRHEQDLAGDENPTPLHFRLQAARKARNLSQSAVGRLFGVSQVAISKWELGPLPDETGKVRGLAIPEELVPLVVRWLDTNEAPTEAELASRRTRRTGVRQAEEQGPPEGP